MIKHCKKQKENGIYRVRVVLMLQETGPQVEHKEKKTDSIFELLSSSAYM